MQKKTSIDRLKNLQLLDQKSVKNAFEHLVEKVCSECGIGCEWNNKPIVLQLDHIDGNSDNNAVENLRLLCPNCHSQTPTYGSKSLGNKVKKDTRRNRYLQKYKTGQLE